MAESGPDAALLAAVHQSPFACAVFGLDRRCLAANKMLAELCGGLPGGYPGRRLEEILPLSASPALEVFDQVVRGRAAVRAAVFGQGWRVAASGETKSVWEDIWYPVFDEAGELSAVGAAVVDVAQLARVRDYSRSFHLVNQALARSETVAEVIGALEALEDEGGEASQQLWLATDDVLVPVAWNGPELDRIAAARLAASVFGGVGVERPVPVAQVFATGTPRYFETRDAIITEFPEITPVVAAAGVRSSAYVPLRRSDGVFGVLRWSWTEEQAFSAEGRRFFETVGDSLATAYQRALLRERERGERRRSEQVLAALAPLTTASTTAEATRVVTSLLPAAIGANGASVALIDPSDPGRRRILGSVGYPQEFIERIRETSIDFPTPPNRVMVTSEPLFIHSSREMQRAFPDIAETLAGAASAWATLPLRSRGRTIGAMTLSFAAPQPFPRHQQVELAWYATYIADALARTLRQEEDHTVAVHLQRSLLPASLPRLEGVALTARYLPGSDMEIGGDWYDAVALADGRLFLVVGDVMGHGVEAAVAMGQLRAAGRALAQAHGPAALLSELDRFVEEVEEGSMATLAAVVVDPATGRLEYSLAGHPPPFLRSPDGLVRRLDAALGPPLGVSPEPRQVASGVAEPGSLLVLYTDGLVERRGEDLGASLDRLQGTVGALDPADTEWAADDLVTVCMHDYRQRDDIALVCVGLAPLGAIPARRNTWPGDGGR